MFALKFTRSSCQNPNYTFGVSACAVNVFLLDLFAFPKSFFLSLRIKSALFLAGRGFRKIPEVQEVHFNAFQWAFETRVSLDYFQVTLLVAHFLVYVSLKGAYLGMVLQRSCSPAQVKCQS